MIENKKNIYVGHRYVPLIMGVWNQLVTYEGLSIVTWEGTSYTSKKRVPEGVSIDNEEYWVVTGNYNAQIENYRAEVKSLKEETTEKLNSLTINLKHHGGIPNDKTVDNALIINSLIGFYKNNYRLTIVIDDTYYVNSRVNLTDNSKIDGAKGKLIVFDNCDDYYSVVSLQNTINASVINLTIDQNVSNQTRLSTIDGSANARIGIYMAGSINAVVENNTIESCGVWAIVAQTGPLSNFNKNIIVRNNKINWKQSVAIQSPNLPVGVLYDNTMIYIDADNFLIENNVLTTTDLGSMTGIETHRHNGSTILNTVNGARNGFYLVTKTPDTPDVLESTSHQVKNNKTFNVEEGIILHPYNIEDLSSVEITGNILNLTPNRFEQAHSNGISVKQYAVVNQTAKVINAIISENIITFGSITKTFTDPNASLNFAGINLASWVDLKNVVVTNNVVIDSPAIGILLGGKILDEKQYVVDGCIIENNLIRNSGKNQNVNNTFTAPIVLLGGFQNVFVGKNNLIDDKADGTYVNNKLFIRDLLGLNSFTIDEQIFNGFSSLDKDIIYYVRVSGSDGEVGSTVVSAFKTIKYALQRVPKILKENITIDIGAGLFDEEIDLSGYTGEGTLTILGLTNNTTVKNVVGSNCSASVFVYRLIAKNELTNGFDFKNMSYLFVADLRSDVSSLTSYGINCSDGGFYFINDCVISNRKSALRSNKGAKVLSKIWYDSLNNVHALTAEDGGEIIKVGSQPSFTVGLENIITSGLIR